MKVSVLTIGILCLFVLVINSIAKIWLRRLKLKENSPISILENEDNESYFPPIIENEEITKEERDEVITELKSQDNIVLSVKNDCSTSNPRIRKDYNDKQNLNAKYNKNTYRSTNGRYRSLKNAV